MTDDVSVGDKVHVEFDGEVVDLLGKSAARVEYTSPSGKYTVLIAVELLEQA